MSIGVLLLSGGRSSRMGVDKARLDINGQTLIDWQKTRFEKAGFKVISELSDRFSGFLGPLAGIDAALTEHPEITEWCVIPVDMPALSVKAIEELIRKGQMYKGERDKKDKKIAVPILAAFDRCPLPLYLTAEPELKNRISEWLSDEHGKRSLFALHHQFDGQWVENDYSDHELVNLNTPEQWQEFMQEETNK